MAGARLFAAVLCLLTCSSAAFAQAAAPVVFSARFVRPHGRPDTFERTFAVPPWVIGPFTLRLQNGDSDGSNRLVLGWVWVNGKRVVAPSDLRRNRSRRVDEEHERASFPERDDDDEEDEGERRRGRAPSDGIIVRDVTLQSLNTLRVRLSGRRSRYLTVTISGSKTDRLPPQLTVLSPAEGAVVANVPFTVSGGVTDDSSVTVALDGVAAAVVGSTWSATVAALPPGEHALTVVAIDAAGNQSVVTRRIAVADPCRYVVSPSSVTAAADGAGGFVTMSTLPGCLWTTSASAPWVAITRVAEGYSAEVLGDDAAGYWRLDDADEGGTLRDSSGHGVDGALLGGYTQGVPGALAAGNSATLFEGGSVQFANGPTLLGGPFSVEAWLRDPWSGTIAAGSGWKLTIESGSVRFRAERNEVERFNVRSQGTLDDGEWHQVVATYDPAHQTAALFVDGVLDASGPTPLSPLGGSTFFSMGPMTVTLDELAVYRVALGGERVAAHFDRQGNASGGAGLVSYTIAPNASLATRSAFLTIGGVAVPIVQAARSVVVSEEQTPAQRPGFHYAVAAGLQHSLALKKDGSVWSWGANGSSQLGDGTTVDRSLPVLAAVGDVVAIAAGDAHSIALKSDGTVWAFGANGRGQLGDGSVTFRAVPVQTPGLADIVAIAAGSEHSVALKGDGTVWTWGRNNLGQVGDATIAMRMSPAMVPEFSSGAIAVGANGWRTFVVDAQGRLWAFGDGAFTPSQIPLAAPVAVVPEHPDAIPLAIGETLQVSAGASHTLALQPDGALWAWGSNGKGELGDGTMVARPFPVKIADPGFAWHTGTPVMTSGGTFAAEWVAMAASATAGAVIHYTLSEAEPAESDPIMPVAPAGIPITRTTTLKTRAWAAGTPPSGVASETYTLKVPSLDVSPASGTYAVPQQVTLTPHTGGATIRFSVDGSEPTATSALYAGPIPIAGATVLKAVAFKDGWSPSDTVTAAYAFIVAPPPPVVEPPETPPVVPPSSTLPSGCVFHVAPGAVAVSAEPTAGELLVQASDASCGWSAMADVPWLAIDATGNGSPYAQAISADHPAGYWRLGDAGGARAASDSSGSGRIGNVSGGVTFGVAGPLADRSTAAMFDGTSGAIEIARDAAWSLSALTWEAWVNVAAVSSEWRWILGEGNANETFSLWIPPGSQQPMFYYGAPGALRQATTLHATIVGAGWVHVAFAFGASSWHAYVNGVEQQAGESGADPVATVGPIVLGRDYVGESWYDGALAETAIYPYVLTAQQIAYHAAQRSVMGRGAGHFSYSAAANATGAARSASIGVAGVSVPVAQSAIGGVAIAGSSSSPGANGWTNADVTVSFVCAGAGAIICPPSVLLSRDGEHRVPGHAANDLGATASTEVDVRVDKTPPYVSVSWPSRGRVVATGALEVRGTTIDLLSGVTAVTCNGEPAALADVGFSCNVVVAPGASTVAVRAFDVASNARTAVVSVTTEEALSASPPASLRISPQNTTMVSGETRRFSLVDNLNRVASHVDWSVDSAVDSAANNAANNAAYDAAIITLSSDAADPASTSRSEVVVTAVSAGVATVTARWQGLIAAARVTVVAGAAAPIGAVVWSSPAVHGAVEHIVQGAVTLDNQRRVYALEHDDSMPEDLIRAFDVDGSEVWAAPVAGHVVQLSGDPFGGIVALHGDTITGFTSGGDEFPVGARSGPGFAIDANGVTYYVSDGALVGAGSAGSSLPLPQPDTAGGSTDAGIPTILEDGRIALPVHVTNTGLMPDRLQLLVMAPEGVAATQTVWESPAAVPVQDGTWYKPPADAVIPYKAVPNGRGDILVMWSALHASLGSASNPASAYVGVLRADGRPADYLAEVGGTWGIPGRYPFGDLVVAEDRLIATAYRLFDAQNEAVASQLTLTGSMLSQDAWSVAEGQVPPLPTFLAVAGGGFVASYPDGTMGGTDASFSGLHLAKAQYASDGHWIGATNAGLTSVAGPKLAEANSVWSAAQGSRQSANAALRPGVGLFLKGQPVFLHYFHTSIRMVPRHIDFWIQKAPDVFGPAAKRFPDQGAAPPIDAFGNYFGTLGAESSLGGLQSCGGLLRSNPNRERDVSAFAFDLEPLIYSSFREDQLIDRLLTFDARYNDQLVYDCFPHADTGEYNSNSYSSGLTKAAKLPEPWFPLRELDSYPGWLKPVPETAFK